MQTFLTKKGLQFSFLCVHINIVTYFQTYKCPQTKWNKNKAKISGCGKIRYFVLQLLSISPLWNLLDTLSAVVWVSEEKLMQGNVNCEAILLQQFTFGYLCVWKDVCLCIGACQQGYKNPNILGASKFSLNSILCSFKRLQHRKKVIIDSLTKKKDF